MKREWGSQWDNQMMNYLMKSGPTCAFEYAMTKAFNPSCLIFGAGPETPAVTKYSDDIVGINVSIKELLKIKHLRVSLILGDAQKLPLRQSSFDMIICRSTLHHLLSLNGALAEMRAVLKNDGYIFLHEPGLLNFVAFLGRRFFPTRLHTPLEKPFNPIILRKVLSRNFKIAKEIDFFIFVHLLPIAGKWVKILRNHHFLRAMFDLDALLSRTFLRNLCWILVFLLKKE